MLGYVCVLFDGQSCSSTALVGMLAYLCVLFDSQSSSNTASRGMLGYLCVLLMVKAVVVLLSWDVRLPLCIVDSPKL